jgi:hypothetical protein
MPGFSIPDLHKLFNGHQEPCLSFFVPTHRATKEVQQGAIRLKNLAKTAEELVISDGMRPVAARELLAPVHKLIADDFFWQYQKDGLALFLSPDFTEHYTVPLALRERVVVARRFHVKPLLPLLTLDSTFYILGLSQSRPRLFEAGLDHIDELELESLPASLAGALRFDDAEKQLQFHTRTSGIAGRPAVFHGHGLDGSEDKDAVLRYFREVDKGLRDFLNASSSPLVLAGVDYYFPLYREANSYPHLVDEGITGSPDLADPRELHSQAWRIVEPMFRESREKALSRYQDLKGTGRTADDIKEIVPAGFYGRVDTLFLSQGAQLWGVSDPASGVIEIHKEQTARNEDLLDLAAVQTLLNGGATFLLGPEEMPDGKDAAAILRY